MDKKTKKGSMLLKQATILAAASLFSRFLGFLYRVPITNLIGDLGNAIYSGSYNIYNFLLILSSAGLPVAVGRMVSERLALKQYKNAHKVFKVSLCVAAILGFLGMTAIFFGAGWISVKVLKIPETEFALSVMAPTVFIVAIMSVYRGYFQGMNTMVPTAISQVIEQVFNAVFSVVMAYVLIGTGVNAGEKNIPMGAAGGTIGTGIGAFFGLMVVFFAYSLIKPDLSKRMYFEVDLHPKEKTSDIVRILFSTAVPIIIGTAIFSITNIADTSMVMSRIMASGAYTEAEAKILYGQLGGKYVVLTTLPVSITTAMATAAVPNIAASIAVNDKESVKYKLNLVLKVAMVIAIPAAVGMGVLGDQILKLLYPSSSGGGMLLKIGSFSIIFLALSQIVTGILQGIGKVKVPAISAFFGGTVKLILNYYLIAIPVFNVYGAVIATTACYIVASGINLAVLVKASGVKLDLKSALLKPAAASCVMGVGCFTVYYLIYLFIKSNTVSTLLTVFIGIILYFGFLLAIRGLSREEIDYIPCGRRLNALLDKLEIFGER